MNQPPSPNQKLVVMVLTEPLRKTGLPLLKSVRKPLIKSVLIPLGLIGAASASETDVAIQIKFLDRLVPWT